MSDRRNKWVRRGARLGLFALVPLLSVVFLALAVRLGNAAQPAAALPSAGKTAFEFVGRIDQDGANMVSYGYLTYADGLDGSVLFSGADHSESTARITFYTTGGLTARSVISGVFVLNAIGNTTFYFNSYPGANFSNPASFRSGQPIATYTGRYQNVLNVQGPNLGISTNLADMTQQTGSAFEWGGQTYTFGQAGMTLRSFFTGEGTRTDPVLPKSFVVGAGTAAPTGYFARLPLVRSSAP